MLNRTSLETVEYRIQIIIPVQTIQITTTPFPMSKGWNRWRYTRFPVRGGRQIPGPTGNSSLFVVFGVRGLGTSRGKERRRTSRPTNLHIWLRVATAPIGIAKSQIGLVRGPDPLRASLPLDSTETVFVEKYFPASFSLRYLSLHAFPLSRDFNTWNYATRGLFDRV